MKHLLTINTDFNLKSFFSSCFFEF